jgi:hypothetical protein
MEYLIQRPPNSNGDESWVWEHSLDVDEALGAPSEGRGVIPCLNREEGISVLKSKHDRGLPSPLTYVSNSSHYWGQEGRVEINNNPGVDRQVSIQELVSLTREHGRLWLNYEQTNELRDEEEGYKELHESLEEAGLYSVGGRGGNFFEFNPSKIKSRRKQGKYYRRGRMRNGDVPIFVVRNLVYRINNWISGHGLGGYLRNTGSTLGCLNIFDRQYEGLKQLDLRRFIRKDSGWWEYVEDASHYVVGCETNLNISSSFPEHVRAECEALNIEVPTYKKGQRL